MSTPRRRCRSKNTGWEQFSPQQITSAKLAGEKIQNILTQVPGNGAPIGGCTSKVTNVLQAQNILAGFRILLNYRLSHYKKEGGVI